MTLLLVSNRLPVTLKRVGDRLDVRVNPGGVAAGLASFYREHGARWFGWPGDVDPAESPEVATRLEEEFDCHPVFLSRKLARSFYAGFSNGTLWPLFHSFSTYARYSASEWTAYREVNERFADEVAHALRSDDVVWIHDYQLLLVPQMIRERAPDARIGFFLHIPFPPYDVFRLLPWHRELLRGVLGADLVGFHTYDYMRAFVGSVRRGLGYESRIGTIATEHRVVQADVFPLGIDVEAFAFTSVGPAAASSIARLRRALGSSKLLFSVSRLDYTKGIREQIEAFGRFLESHPEWRRKVAYVLAVVPSRERVAEYARLKREIDERVGRINSRYGTLAWTPIRYLYRQLEFEELLALYRASDVGFITPLRDGMNLVAKEYVASRQEPSGVLILSEMAGASRELLEALVVNPNDVDEVVDAIGRALTMPAEEQAARIRAMQDRLRRYDARTWATKFLERLDDVVRLSQDLAVKRLSGGHRDQIRRAFHRARRRLLLLEGLGSDAANYVALVSGRSRQDLEKWFGEIPITLIGEHGAWVRDRRDRKWEAMLSADPEWKERVRPFIDRFVERLPGSAVEEKDFSLAWHYRSVDIETGMAAARELVDVLTSLTASLDLQVFSGNRVVEIRRGGVNKGTFFATRLAREPWDFILAVGDDSTDEALFSALPASAWSIRVGFGASSARFSVEAVADVLDLLETLPSEAPTLPKKP